MVRGGLATTPEPMYSLYGRVRVRRYVSASWGPNECDEHAHRLLQPEPRILMMTYWDRRE